jgi:hypothetical protein
VHPRAVNAFSFPSSSAHCIEFPEPVFSSGLDNRATNVNFTINVGARVPRQVRLELLPAAIFRSCRTIAATVCGQH